MKAIAQLYCIISGLLITLVCHAGNTITAAVDEDIIADYQLFIGERDPISVTYYGGAGARRDVIELVLLQQALHLGGFTGKVIMRPENSYLRILKLVQDGQVPLSGALMWREDLISYSDSLFTTKAVIKEGEFIAGLYTHATNTKALSATTPDKIRQLSAASNDHWKADVATLKSLGIKKIHYATYWVQIVRMVVADRADITLAPFQSNSDMKVHLDNLELVPIPGVKVSLPGSRHWPISKKHPRGEEIYTALEKGIRLLEEKNIIQRAYEECGFFHPAVKEWKLVNPHP
ncbi:hypothetical protein [Cellvibrio sp. NN19]|uniref:hypothetical protein n=1 Tax=Cellvibrio chitinivorans TaxID=3102792 RepID=UPI002B416D68|nr:hypothetical protein [Cellvibrio sp. NN19]